MWTLSRNFKYTLNVGQTLNLNPKRFEKVHKKHSY